MAAPPLAQTRPAFHRGAGNMTREELTAWALASGWKLIAGAPCLTRPGAPKDAIVRIVFKATVANLEVRKPAGKWDKGAGAAYDKITLDPETERPAGLGLETVPSLSMLMQKNKDERTFASFGKG